MLHGDLIGVFVGFLEVARGNEPIRPVDAEAWMRINKIRDQAWWWKMFVELDKVRMKKINEAS